MSRMFLALIALIALIAMTPAAFAQPVTRVYRIDTRPPAEVFRDGLRGVGLSLDVLEHSLGNSCREPDPLRASAWISMTYDREEAIGFAEGLLGADAHPFVWLYTIRPDNGYLSVENLVRQAIDSAEFSHGIYTPDHARTLHWLLARTPIREEREVVATRVAPANILEAIPVRYVGDELTFGHGVTNGAYVAANTSVGAEVEHLPNYIPLASIRMDIWEDDRVSASCAMSCDESTMSASSRGMAATKPTDRYCAIHRKNVLTPTLQFLLLGSP